jgi:hypothetical protein
MGLGITVPGVKSFTKGYGRLRVARDVERCLGYQSRNVLTYVCLVIVWYGWSHQSAQLYVAVD